MRHLRRTIGLLLMAGCYFVLPGQSAPLQQDSPSLATYESFFLAVSRLVPGTANTANGEAINPVRWPGLEEALEITAEQAQLLRTVAADSVAKSTAIDEALKPLVLALRLSAVAEEAPLESVSRRYGQLNRQRVQMVLDHIQELRAAFGERFRVIDTFVSARKNAESFFVAQTSGK